MGNVQCGTTRDSLIVSDGLEANEVCMNESKNTVIGKV